VGLFDTIPAKLPRWAIKADDTVSAYVEEPMSQTKDVGSVPTEFVAHEHYNWVLQTAYTWFGYLRDSLVDLFTENHVANDGVTTNCEVTQTAIPSMAVTVADGKVWIQGAFYEVTGANVSLAPADPGDPRIDVIVAEVSGGVVSLTKVAGTPAATPAAPAIAANQVRLANVTVPAGAANVLTANIADKRRRGALTVGALKATDTTQLGSLGGATYLLTVDAEAETATFDGTETILEADTTTIGAAGQVVRIGDQGGNYGIQFDGTVIKVDDSAEWRAAVTKKIGIAPAAMVATSSSTLTRNNNEISVTGANTATLFTPIALPDGATVTKLRVVGNSDNALQSVTATLVRVDYATNSIGVMATAAETTGPGDFDVEDTTISNATIDNDAYVYYARLIAANNSAATDTYVRQIQVEYTVTDLAHS
jgi:hypothetical protein